MAIGLEPPQKPGWHFCVEQEGHRWFYGLKRNLEARSLEGPVERALRRLGASEATSWWLGWFWFQGRIGSDRPEYSNWESSSRAWLDMSNGQMAANFEQLARALAASAAAAG
jgi:hypothetical protein